MQFAYRDTRPTQDHIHEANFHTSLLYYPVSNAVKLILQIIPAKHLES